MNDHLLKIPGINIQWPWSRLLLEDRKTVETRSYRIPEGKKHIPLALIETPGPRGKSDANIQQAMIVGIISFTESFLYGSQEEWLGDYGRHLVQPTDPLFGYKANQEKWGWVVKEVIPLAKPVAAPARRGIVFAKECIIQPDFLPPNISSDR